MRLAPLLLTLLVELLLSLIAWGILHARIPEDGSGLMGARHDLFWGLLMLAGLSIVVFISFLLLGPRY